MFGASKCWLGTFRPRQVQGFTVRGERVGREKKRRRPKIAATPFLENSTNRGSRDPSSVFALPYRVTDLLYVVVLVVVVSAFVKGCGMHDGEMKGRCSRPLEYSACHDRSTPSSVVSASRLIFFVFIFCFVFFSFIRIFFSSFFSCVVFFLFQVVPCRSLGGEGTGTGGLFGGRRGGCFSLGYEGPAR